MTIFIVRVQETIIRYHRVQTDSPAAAKQAVQDFYIQNTPLRYYEQRSFEVIGIDPEEDTDVVPA